MQNLLIQWGTEEGNQKIDEYVISEKPPNLVG